MKKRQMIKMKLNPKMRKKMNRKIYELMEKGDIR